MKPWFEAAFAAHYPLLYGHRDETEARSCLALLQELQPWPASRPVLDLGCGQARHLAWLREAGVPALGLDLSMDLLRQAARRPGPPMPLVRGDMRALPWRPGSFGAVLSLFTAFGYFGPLADNAGVVEQVASCLQEGGFWYLDYLDCEKVCEELAGRPFLSRKRQSGCLGITETRRLGPEGNMVIKAVDIRPWPGAEGDAAALGITAAGLQYEEQVALFSRQEMVDLARTRGLDFVVGAGSYEGAPLGRGNRWIMVFRKEGRQS